MNSRRLSAFCASTAFVLSSVGVDAAAAKSELKGAAILDHACGKTSVKHMGLVHAGKMLEAVKLGTKGMQEEWNALPAKDRQMMSGMMKEMSQSEAEFSAQIKAGGLLAVEGPKATLTVKQEQKDANGTSTSTMTQNFEIDGGISRLDLKAPASTPKAKNRIAGSSRCCIQDKLL